MRAALASLLLLLLSTAARAQPLELQARVAVGPMFDQNPARDPALVQPSGGASLVATADVAMPHGETQLTTASADLGLRWFEPAAVESQLATRLALSHAVRTGDWLALVLAASAQDRQIRDDQREGSTLEATLGAELGPWDWFSAGLYGGVRRFVYRGGADPVAGGTRAFSGPVAGASLRAQIDRDHFLSTSYELQVRRYDARTRNAVSVVGADWSYRGRVLLGAGYQLAIAPGDLIFAGNRHRFTASLGVPLPGEVVLGLEATYQQARVVVTTEDDEQYSSLGMRLSRPVSDVIEIEGTLRWYHSFQSTAPYDRVIAVLAAVIVLEDR